MHAANDMITKTNDHYESVLNQKLGIITSYVQK